MRVNIVTWINKEIWEIFNNCFFEATTLVKFPKTIVCSCCKFAEYFPPQSNEDKYVTM